VLKVPGSRQLGIFSKTLPVHPAENGHLPLFRAEEGEVVEDAPPQLQPCQ